MISTELQDDFKPYFLNHPFMSNGRMEMDGNAILYAGTFGLLISKILLNYDAAADHAAELYRLSRLPEKPGIITKGPHKWEDPQTHDDYIGLCTLSLIGSGEEAKEICNQGRKRSWIFFRGGGISDYFNAIFFRIPGVVQHIKICAGEELNWFDQLFWSLSVFFGANSDHDSTSGKILTWHMVGAYEMRGLNHWICNLALKRFNRKISDMYPGLMGDVLGIYHGRTHAFSKWAKGVL